jgi:hypothetical protein
MELIDGIAIFNGRWSSGLADGDWPSKSRIGVGIGLMIGVRRRGDVQIGRLFLLMLHVVTARIILVRVG